MLRLSVRFYFLQTSKKQPSSTLQRGRKSCVSCIPSREITEDESEDKTKDAFEDEKHIEMKLQIAVKNLDQTTFISLAQVRACQFVIIPLKKGIMFFTPSLGLSVCVCVCVCVCLSVCLSSRLRRDGWT